MGRIRLLVGGVLVVGGLMAPVSLAGAATSPNLVTNGGAESGAGGNGQAVAIPNWSKIGPATVVNYGAAGFPNAATPGPAQRGTKFFSGGPANADFGTRTLTQTVSLTGFASDIATGQVDYKVSAWLGGSGAIPDNAQVQINFKTGNGSLVGNTVTLGPVTNADRGNVTKFLSRSKTGDVPASARSVLIQVIFINLDGGAVKAYAENLRLQLLNVGP